MIVLIMLLSEWHERFAQKSSNKSMSSNTLLSLHEGILGRGNWKYLAHPPLNNLLNDIRRFAIFFKLRPQDCFFLCNRANIVNLKSWRQKASQFKLLLNQFSNLTARFKQAILPSYSLFHLLFSDLSQLIYCSLYWNGSQIFHLSAWFQRKRGYRDKPWRAEAGSDSWSSALHKLRK